MKNIIDSLKSGLETASIIVGNSLLLFFIFIIASFPLYYLIMSSIVGLVYYFLWTVSVFWCIFIWSSYFDYLEKQH